MTKDSFTWALSAASLGFLTVREIPSSSSFLGSLEPLDFKRAVFLSIGASCMPSSRTDLVMTEARDVSDGAAPSSASCSSPEDRDGASSRCHEGIDFALFSLIADLVMRSYVRNL